MTRRDYTRGVDTAPPRRPHGASDPDAGLVERLRRQEEGAAEALVAAYEGKMYGHLKVDLAEVVTEHLTPIRSRANELLADPAELDRLLAHGADKAREIASATLQDVYAKVGFLPYVGAR